MTISFPRTIGEAACLIRARKLSPVALMTGVLDRIEAIDPVLSAFVTVVADDALEQAQAAELELAEGHYRGPLHGVPFGAKDNYATRGIRTTGHSKVYADHVPTQNAAVIDSLYAAGALLVGKLALHELAHGGPSFDLPWPPARNPWNPGHFTGGSSSGSAAALGANMVLFALGSDTGGSIPTPASLCGVVGMKPTFGLVSRTGVIPGCHTLDQCGPMTRTVEDCAIVLHAIGAYDARDPASSPQPRHNARGALRSDLEGVRIGVVREAWEEEAPLDAALSRSTDEALRVLERLGATLESVRLRTLREYCDVWTLIEAPETFSVQRDALIARPQDFGAVFLARTLIGCLVRSADHEEALRMRSLLIEEMKPLWARYDVLLTAGAGPAPRLEPALAALPRLDRFSPFALLGVPAIVVPSGYSDAGLPLSIQLVAKHFDDAKLLGIAHAYEQATNWWSQREPDLGSLQMPAPIAYAQPRLSTATMDARIVSVCERAVHSAGLHLADEQLAIMCGAAPNLIDVLERARSRIAL